MIQGYIKARNYLSELTWLNWDPVADNSTTPIADIALLRNQLDAII